jgi:hypothetical protein
MNELVNWGFRTSKEMSSEAGRIGYVILYFLGAPVGLLLILWAILGDNIFGAG